MASAPKTLTSQNLMALYSKRLSRELTPALYSIPVVYELADKHPLPMHAGKHMFVPRHIPQNNIRTLTESTIIGVCATSAHYYSAQIVAYGDAKSYSDLQMDVAEVPGLIAADMFAMTRYSALKVDTLLTAQISNSGTFLTPDGTKSAGDIEATTNLKQNYLFRATTTLAANDAPTYGDGNYVTVVHPRQEYDLFINTSAASQLGRGAAGGIDGSFLEQTDAGVEKLVRATIGVLGGQRVIRNTNAARLAYHATLDCPSLGAAGMESANSGYIAFSLGPGAIGAVDLGTSRFRSYVKTDGGTFDPIEQLITAGVKFRFAALKKDVSNRLTRTASGKTL